MYKNIVNFMSKSVDFISALFHIDRKFIKFLFVGALNTAFAYLLYALLITIGLIPNVALTLQYIIGIIWNFKTTGSIVFKNHDNRLIFKFFGCYLITFSINSVLLYILTEPLRVNDYLAQLILVLPIAMLSFILFKKFVFKENNNNDNNEV